MTAEEKIGQAPAPAKGWARRLRIASAGILLLGAAAAGAVYAFGTAPVVSDDPATIAEDKIDSRQMGQMYGDVGVLEKGWFDDLKEPGTQAVLIAALAVVVAGGGFYAARFLERRGDRAM